LTCRVVILDKGKPAARLGRKATGRLKKSCRQPGYRRDEGLQFAAHGPVSFVSAAEFSATAKLVARDGVKPIAPSHRMAMSRHTVFVGRCACATTGYVPA